MMMHEVRDLHDMLGRITEDINRQGYIEDRDRIILRKMMITILYLIEVEYPLKDKSDG